MPMLQVKDISVFYGKIQALNSVSLEVRQGEVVALIGMNGGTAVMRELPVRSL